MSGCERVKGTSISALMRLIPYFPQELENWGWVLNACAMTHAQIVRALFKYSSKWRLDVIKKTACALKEMVYFHDIFVGHFAKKHLLCILILLSDISLKLLGINDKKIVLYTFK